MTVFREQTDNELCGKQSKAIFCKILFGFGLITALAVCVTGEYTLRHLLFPLATALLAVWGECFHENRKGYWETAFLFAVPILSGLLARLYVEVPIRFWEFGTIVAFSAAIAFLMVTLIACIPVRFIRMMASFLVSFVLSFVAIAVWGHIFAEGAWPNADSVAAVLQTNPQEAGSYLRDTLGIRAVCLIVFAFLYSFLSALKGMELKACLFGIWRGVFFVLFLVACVSGIGRTRENLLSIPVYEAQDYLTYIEDFKKARAEREAMGIQMSLSAEKKQSGLFVLVIGEAATRDHLSAYGYERKTTPWMDSLKGQEGFFFFNNAYSCYTTTSPALAYALTAANQYTDNAAAQAPSILEIAKAAGYKTAWLSNQVHYSAWDNPNTVLADGADTHIWMNTHLGKTLLSDFPDGALVEKLDDLPKADNMLVILHLMGSHNSYQDRYPAEFAKFSGGKTHVDEYDGSILYTDYVLQQIYEKVSASPNFQAMIYFSDHGEGVDFGLFHGTSKFVWPMTRVPLFIAVSPQYAKLHPEVCMQLKEHENVPFTNDLICDLMVGLMRLKGDGIYDERNDLSSAAYDGREDRFLTLYGKKHIAEDLRK